MKAILICISDWKEIFIIIERARPFYLRNLFISYWLRWKDPGDCSYLAVRIVVRALMSQQFCSVHLYMRWIALTIHIEFIMHSIFIEYAVCLRPTRWVGPRSRNGVGCLSRCKICSETKQLSKAFSFLGVPGLVSLMMGSVNSRVEMKIRRESDFRHSLQTGIFGLD